MEPLTEALKLLRRYAEIETARRQPGGIRVLEERELFQLQAHLERIPVAARAVMEASRLLHRTVDTLTVEDIEKVEGGIH